MARKKEPLKTIPVKKKGEGQRGERSINTELILHTHLYSEVRKRLKVKSKDLPNYKIKKIVGEITKAIVQWIVDNPEGFRMPFDMGYLAISKYILIPFREDRFEIINRVKELSPDIISDRFREIVLKKYGKPLTKVQAFVYLKQGKMALIPMWYNHRNCSVRKARVFKWKRPNHLKDILKKTDKTKFYSLNFHDFYDYKIKALDSY